MYAESQASDDLRHLILDIARAAKYIQFAIRTTETGLAGSQNQFGEEQVKLDVLSDDIISQHLCESRLVSSFASEEQPAIVQHSDAYPFSVVFDPLDGSSLVDTNFAIGSIFGIYEGSGILRRTPREQVAALYVLYGPRTLLVYSTGKGVHEFLLNDVGEFVLLRQYLGIADSAKNFSPGNLRVLEENPGYTTLLQHWLTTKLTLRYSGCMVADVHHLLSKGQGVFVNVGSAPADAALPQTGKLRLAFECGPFAWLLEQAGGTATDGLRPILDIPIESIDQRTAFLCGSSQSVAEAAALLRV